jgi:hypothetical protein
MSSSSSNSEGYFNRLRELSPPVDESFDGVSISSIMFVFIFWVVLSKIYSGRSLYFRLCNDVLDVYSLGVFSVLKLAESVRS